MPSSVRVVGAIALAGAIALLLFGGVRENFRPIAGGRVPEDTPVPVCLEPAGDLEHPPTLFRWTSGGDDVDFAQVLLFDERLNRVWSSAPVTGAELRVESSVFDGLQAGTLCSWSVREVRQGRPRATSALAEFSFEFDTQGRPVGESLPAPEILRR